MFAHHVVLDQLTMDVKRGWGIVALKMFFGRISDWILEQNNENFLELLHSTKDSLKNCGKIQMKTFGKTVG